MTVVFICVSYESMNWTGSSECVCSHESGNNKCFLRIVSRLRTRTNSCVANHISYFQMLFPSLWNLLNLSFKDLYRCYSEPRKWLEFARPVEEEQLHTMRPVLSTKTLYAFHRKDFREVGLRGLTRAASAWYGNTLASSASQGNEPNLYGQSETVAMGQWAESAVVLSKPARPVYDNYPGDGAIWKNLGSVLTCCLIRGVNGLGLACGNSPVNFM